MKTTQYLMAALLLLATALPFALAKDEEDDDGFFYFQDDNDWSESAIMPNSCIETSTGDAVVFTMYKKNHNQCKRRSNGSYKLSIASFVRSYVKQMQVEYERKGADYEVDEDAMEYLECQQYYYNNNMFYLKIGCRSNGQGFQVHPYTDYQCTTRASLNYNLGIDVSSLRVNFGSCKSCISSSYGNNNYNQYNNNNNNNNGNANNYYGQEGNGYYDLSDHDSMLCSAANEYKESCNRSCRRAAKKASNGSKSSSSMNWSGGFSPIGKFFLWVLSLSAIFFLLAGLAQRKKMSKQDAVIEEAAIKSAGVDKKFIPRILVGFVLFVILLVLFRKKVLTWFFLIAMNIALLAYWMHLKNKAEQNATVGGFQMYSENGTPA